MFSSLDVAQMCAKAAEDKKAFEVRILDLRGLTYITDYFVICSGSNTTQVGAVSDGIGQALALKGIHPSHIEGGEEARWVLMDYGDVVVHIFEEQTRLFYGLDKLWGDAPLITISASVQALFGASS